MGAIVLYLAITILIGCVFSFFGNKLYFPIIMGSAFVGSILVSIDKFGMTSKGLLMGAIVGFIFALLSKFIYKVGVFLLGGLGGFAIGSLLYPFLPQGMADFKWMFIFLVALIFAICAVVWCDLFIILSTASTGASIIAPAICFLALKITKLSQFIYADGTLATVTHLGDFLHGQFIEQNSFLIMVVSIMLFFVGVGYQTKNSKTS